MLKHSNPWTSALLTGLMAAALSCELVPDDDFGDDDTGIAGENDSGASGGDPTGDSSGVCAGIAYTRTDDPGTAVCLNGSSSFMCSWGGGNPDVDGVFVDGRHDEADDQLILCFPDDPSNTTCTDFTFDMIYGAGPDLVLEYMASRAGDYAKMGSWADATAGDAGVCGGGASTSDDTAGSDSGGDATSDTCDGPCNGDIDCNAGEACVSTVDGLKCLAQECQSCFDQGQGCLSNTLTCEFSECSAGDPDYSDTCSEPCGGDQDCNAGESCVDLSVQGRVCVASECWSCFDAGQSCNWVSTTCEFSGCG